MLFDGQKTAVAEACNSVGSCTDSNASNLVATGKHTPADITDITDGATGAPGATMGSAPPSARWSRAPP